MVDYDCVFCLTITTNRSPINANATRASFGILKDYRPARQSAGITGPFLMRVIDTQTLFAGSDPAVVAAVQMAESELAPAQIRERLEHICHREIRRHVLRNL